MRINEKKNPVRKQTDREKKDEVTTIEIILNRLLSTLSSSFVFCTHRQSKSNVCTQVCSVSQSFLFFSFFHFNVCTVVYECSSMIMIVCMSIHTCTLVHSVVHDMIIITSFVVANQYIYYKMCVNKI